MSVNINRIESVPPVRAAQSSNTGVGDHSQPHVGAGAAHQSAQVISGTASKQGNSVVKNGASPYQLPTDVVEVHQDPAIKNQVIIQYLDRAGDVVLQVPSNQELNVERGIVLEFQQAAKQRLDASSVAAAANGAKQSRNS
jgi:hypothetical protein